MPNVDTWLIPAKDLTHNLVGMTPVRRQFNSGTAIAQNDVVRLLQIPKNMVVFWAKLSHNGTLGASATMQLRRGTTALTIASTAGGASHVSSAATLPDEPNTTDGTDYLNIVVAGAAAGTSALVTCEVLLAYVVPALEV